MQMQSVEEHRGMVQQLTSERNSARDLYDRVWASVALGEHQNMSSRTTCGCHSAQVAKELTSKVAECQALQLQSVAWPGVCGKEGGGKDSCLHSTRLLGRVAGPPAVARLEGERAKTAEAMKTAEQRAK